MKQIVYEINIRNINGEFLLLINAQVKGWGRGVEAHQTVVSPSDEFLELFEHFDAVGDGGVSAPADATQDNRVRQIDHKLVLDSECGAVADTVYRHTEQQGRLYGRDGVLQQL